MATLDITSIRLKECLRYNQETGVFIWIKPTSNRVKVGYSPTYTLNNGYRAVRLDGRLYTAHRLAWLYCYERWPESDIDHINGIRSDNRITNLREVSRTINLQNRRTSRVDSQFGLLGVSRDKNKFSARIKVNGKVIYIGNFLTAEDAHVAYIDAKRKFHPGNTI